jgi:hypothetical protein
MFARSQQGGFCQFNSNSDKFFEGFTKRKEIIFVRRLFKTNQFFRDVYLSKLNVLLDVKASVICSGRKDFGGTWQPKVNIWFGKSKKINKLFMITFVYHSNCIFFL